MNDVHVQKLEAEKRKLLERKKELGKKVDRVDSEISGLEKKITIEHSKEQGFVFDTLKELVQNEYPNKEIVEQDDGFYLNEDDRKTKIEVPQHYICSTHNIIVKGSAHETQSIDDNGNIKMYRECSYCGEPIGEVSTVGI